jgi:hypothetical protein
MLRKASLCSERLHLQKGFIIMFRKGFIFRKLHHYVQKGFIEYKLGSQSAVLGYRPLYCKDIIESTNDK